MISGAVIFIASIFSPLLSVSELYIFTSTITIFSALATLLIDEEWLLFWVILIFAIVLPAVKYMLLITNVIKSNPPSNNTYKLLEGISKWAMLDVFVVAVIVASVKLKLFAQAQTHFGLYLFVIAVILSIVCANLQKKFLAKK
ncbi:MAG: paraquat-inducible protein A [Gammaproteobacteria bacterium]|nr:paraquat-inducible protein A [Gammaproteobacteria bacterium]